MKAEDYRKLSDVELEKTLKELRFELIKSKGVREFAKIKDKKGKKTKGGNLQPRIRKEIARVLTIQNERRKTTKGKD